MNTEIVRLITDADDMGCCHSANRAFYDAYKKGILRNGNIIITGYAVDEAVEMFKNEKGFCLGLHATVTCEWNTHRWKSILPAGRVRSFTEPDGTMMRTTMAIHRAGPRFAEMLAEMQAQLDKARALGLNIQYISTHMDPRWLFEKNEDDRFGDHVMKWVEKEGLVSRSSITRTRLPEPPEGITDRIERFVWQINAAEPGLYMTVTHAAYDDEEMRGMWYEGNETPGAVARERDIDRLMYMDPRVLKACSDKGVRLVQYTDL